MNKIAIFCIIIVASICLISIITYESNISTEDETLNYEPLPDTTNLTDTYLNSSEDKKEDNTPTTQPIHHTTTSYSYDYDDSYDDAVGDEYYYDDAYYNDAYGDTWEYDDEGF